MFFLYKVIRCLYLISSQRRNGINKDVSSSYSSSLKCRYKRIITKTEIQSEERVPLHFHPGGQKVTRKSNPFKNVVSLHKD